MAKDILEYFTDENAQTIAKEICDKLATFKLFGSKNPKEKELIGLVDFSYNIKEGKMKEQASNTWFSFDLTPGTVAFDFMKAMYAREINENDDKLLNEFIGKVATILSNEKTPEIRDIVRSAVMPDSEDRVVPLAKVDILGIELVDYSSVDPEDRCTMKLVKLPDIPVNMQAVMSRVMELRETTKMTSAQIIEKERLSGNPMFDAILGIVKGDKYLWEAQLAMFVDYSLSEDFLAAVKFAKEG